MFLARIDKLAQRCMEHEYRITELDKRTIQGCAEKIGIPKQGKERSYSNEKANSFIDRYNGYVAGNGLWATAIYPQRHYRPMATHPTLFRMPPVKTR
jgi:hypothetical protein